jgi:hypothetical protein
LNTKEFHIGDVISITANLIMPPHFIRGMQDILTFITGGSVLHHQIPQIRRECAPFLKKQFSFLDSAEMDFAVAELKEMLKTPSGKEDPTNLIIGWLSKLTCGKYGIECKEMLAVKPLEKTK